MYMKQSFLVSLSVSVLIAACAVPGENSQTIDDAAQSSMPDEIMSAEVPQDCVPGKTTTATTEGPYYTEGSPETNKLFVEGMAGQKIIISGYVFTKDCSPIANVWVDFWQADENGVYDNQGYKLRGHTFTDASGLYTFETVVPGLYGGRTLHIHAKVAAMENGKVLTTQLLFPGAEENESDSIYRDDLLINLDTSSDPWRGTFNFVLSE
jgi:protocatechuate 3,4-dioxygenase beta subunit